MRLSRLWENRSLGIHPTEAGQPETMAAFERRARRHAGRLSAKIGVVGIALICGLWGVIIYAAHQETQSAMTRARAQGQNLTAAFAAESTRMLDSIVLAMDAVTDRVRDDLLRGFTPIEAARLTAEIDALVRPTVRSAILDVNGRVVYSTLPAGLARLDFSVRDEFRSHRRPHHHRLHHRHCVRPRRPRRASIPRPYRQPPIPRLHPPRQRPPPRGPLGRPPHHPLRRCRRH